MEFIALVSLIFLACGQAQTRSASSDNFLSFVIPVYKEDPFLLHQTLNSILKNVTSSLISEIIVIDDFNDPPIVFEENLPLVKLYRNTLREGLIRSRLNGANLATGNILVFLDSHIVINRGAIENLVHRLVSNRASFKKQEPGAVDYLIVSPVIDTIKESDLSYLPADPDMIGDLDSWDLTYTWRKGNFTDVNIPRATPILSGSIFATYKDSFFKYGALDPGMNIWGGENIELSLRTWLCGGRIEIIPQSRIGHVFRTRHPYSFPAGKARTVLKNLKRVAMVWFFHKTSKHQASAYMTNFYHALPDAAQYSPDDLESRKALLENLHCKSFDWFFNTTSTNLQIKTIDELDKDAILKAFIDVDFYFQ